MFSQLTFVRLGWMWISAALALWITDAIFDSLWFDGFSSVAVSALVLTLVNLTLKPLLMLLSLPFIVMSLGLAIPLLNGLVLLVVAELVTGFHISGYWMGVAAGLAVSFVTFLLAVATGQRLMRVQVGGGRGVPHRREQHGPSPSGGASPSGRPSAPSDDDVIDVEVREKKESDRP